MITSILIPTDFSPASWNATQVGIELYQHYKEASISFLHVYPDSSRYSGKELPNVTESQLQQFKERMNHLSQNLIDFSDDKIQNVVLTGNVEKTILQFIKDHQFDLVIVGINSNGSTNEIGSHTVKVIRESGVPVMIVPNRTSHGAIAS
ncbi:Nucleotide-binding universal stress protein, UspA family [Ekhidna lutea]|uniref:Nucleotide-binding universal stress protein, UspA family n=1 Tax=Ekhidna lutea TaxID=447679 RepID=A0A239LBJ2_EKHLU|nr:universal stress protein [Ekhidna lutea]SNT27288.1 Nucleotide-binding universal stress protein, UspA family [Ekhidna lutea]